MLKNDIYKKILVYLSLLIIPFMMGQTTLSLNKAKGPSWVGMNCDPDYTYLLNALNLAMMKKVGHIDHPGTTVQITGAIILRAVHLLRFSPKEDLQTDVIENPELYLSVINKVFLGLNVLILIILGMWTFCLTMNLPITFFVQLTPYFLGTEATYLFCLTSVRPEPFLLLASLLFVFLIITYAYKETEVFSNFIFNTRYVRELSPDSLFLICFAVVSGFGLATKFSFIPLLAIPLVILPTFKRKILFILGTSLSFVFFTIPIIKEYKTVFIWLLSIGTHAGSHGKGIVKVIDFNLFLSNLNHFFSKEKFFIIILFLSMCILITGYALQALRKISFGNIHFKLLLGVSLAQLLGLVMVAKVSNGWEVHYLLPVSSLSGVTLVLIIFCLRQLFSGFNIGVTGTLTAQKVKYIIFNLDSKMLLIIILIPIIFYARKNEITGAFRWKSLARNQCLSVYVKAENEYKDYAKVYYLGSSSPAFALRLGSDPAYAVNYDDCIKEDNAEIFEKLYPNVYFYNIFERKFFNWSNEIPFEEVLSRHNNKIIFQGPRFEELFSRFTADSQKGLVKPHLLLRDIFKGEGEGLSRDTIYELVISK
jgi:hypothetical protein